MTKLNTLAKRFLANESGATAIEYGVMAGLIAVVLIPIVGGLGTKLSSTFTTISTGLPG